MRSERFSRRERFGLFDPKVDNPTLADMQPIWKAAIPAVMALALGLSAVWGSHTEAPAAPIAPDPYELTTTTTLQFDSYELCRQAAINQIKVGNAAQGQVDLERCRQQQLTSPQN